MQNTDNRTQSTEHRLKNKIKKGLGSVFFVLITMFKVATESYPFTLFFDILAIITVIFILKRYKWQNTGHSGVPLGKRPDPAPDSAGLVHAT